MIWRIEHIHHRLSLWIIQHNNAGQDGYVCERWGNKWLFCWCCPTSWAQRESNLLDLIFFFCLNSTSCVTFRIFLSQGSLTACVQSFWLYLLTFFSKCHHMTLIMNFSYLVYEYQVGLDYTLQFCFHFSRSCYVFTSEISGIWCGHINLPVVVRT